MNAIDELTKRIGNATNLANEALKRYHAKRAEARADGTFSDEVGESDMSEYGKQIAIASELSDVKRALLDASREYPE